MSPATSSLQFVRTTDMRLVRGFLSDPRCYRRMKNDSAPVLEKFHIAPYPVSGIVFVVAVEMRDVAEALVLLCDSKEGMDVAEIHFCFSPEVWGRTEPIARGFLKWVWESTSLERLIGPCPRYNALALKLATAVGFKDCGAMGTVTKNGKEYEVTRMVIGRSYAAASA